MVILEEAVREISSDRPRNQHFKGHNRTENSQLLLTAWPQTEHRRPSCKGRHFLREQEKMRKSANRGREGVSHSNRPLSANNLPGLLITAPHLRWAAFFAKSFRRFVAERFFRGRLGFHH